MKKKIKLIILVNNLGFFCSHRLPIAEEAIKKSFNVVIGYGELGDANLSLLEQKKLVTVHIPIHRGGINIFKDFISMIHIWRFFNIEKPDIVHLITIKPYLYGGIIARLTGVPSLVSAITGLGSLFINNNLKNKILRLFIYPLYFFALGHSNQTIIFHNEDDIQQLRKWKVVKPDKIKLVKGSGVHLEKFKRLDEVKGEKVVCFASRLLEEKGVYEYISAAKLLTKRGIKAKFLLAGDIDTKNPSGLNSDDLEKIEKQGFVKFIGYQKDIPSLFENSHIICLPSYREGFPKTLIEAAAAGRAVVTTDAPGCRDSIIANKTGLLVPIRNIEALANSLQDLIENSSKRENMGKEGRKLAEKEFSIIEIVEAHMKIYFDLIRNIKKS